MRRTSFESGIETIDLDSWKEFYELIASDFASAPAYVFRGQADAEWKVESSLDRWERLHAQRAGVGDGGGAEKDGGAFGAEGGMSSGVAAAHGRQGTGATGLGRRSELATGLGKRSAPATGGSPVSRGVHLRAFRQAIRAISPIALEKEDDALAWALAQHHGLRTPLLDWSLSPFVALYFAFENELTERDGQLARPSQRAVFALLASAIAQGQDNSPAGRGVFPRVYSPSGPVSQRLLAQSSLFLMMPEQTDLESFLRAHHVELRTGTRAGDAPILKRIHIPNRGRRDCLKMLNKMNINRLTLFPDLDGAARYINSLWELDFDSVLGQFEDADYAPGDEPPR